MPNRRLTTRAIHAGERRPPGDFIPVSTPIYSSATFVYEKLETIDQIFGGERAGYTYSRHDNPTTASLEEAVASRQPLIDSVRADGIALFGPPIRTLLEGV